MDMDENTDAEGIEQLLATPGLADALESDRFKQFLDHVRWRSPCPNVGPIRSDHLLQFGVRTPHRPARSEIQGNDWKVLPGVAAPRGDETSLGEAVQSDEEYIGTFTIDRDGHRVDVDAWSNTIESDEGVPIFRLVALASIGQRDPMRCRTICISCCATRMSCFANCSIA